VCLAGAAKTGLVEPGRESTDIWRELGYLDIDAKPSIEEIHPFLHVKVLVSFE